jgi:mevalonate kinase
MKEFYSHGKLLLTGEYVVLDGAKALALPCKLGQSLSVKKHSEPNIVWTSYLRNGELWQKSIFNLDEIIKLNSKNDFEKRLFEILKVIFQINPKVFSEGYSFTTHLEFEKEWGLGSSSTLINNLAQWSQINAFDLLDKTFGGSGYDIAAANMSSPFLYVKQGKTVYTENISLSEKIKSNLYFVYRNQKQNSREGILKYRNSKIDKNKINSISEITDALNNCSDLEKFEHLLITHEKIISDIIGVEPVHSKIFKDYNSGIVKSLGAWGGDFVLVTAKQLSDLEYFKQRGYGVIFSYSDLIY